MTIKFALALDFWSAEKPLTQHLDDYTRLLAIAENYGFSSVWAGEFRPPKSQPGHTPSPLLILSALAGRTNLRLGTGVTLLTLWNPLRLAYDGAILDHLSNGRFTLGVGVGVAPQMKRYGVPPEEAGTRMTESLELLKAMWSGADHYHGKHFHIDGGVAPAPVQPGGPPIWIGGTINRSITRAVEFGDAWYGATQYHFEVIKRQAGLYRERMAAAGKSSPTVAINRTTFLAPTEELARSEGEPYVTNVLEFYARMKALTDAAGTPLNPKSDLFNNVGDDVVFVGTPEMCIASMQRYIDVGVTQFNFRVSMGDMPIQMVERTVRLLGEEVFPHFR